ncbi:MAG: hypothetical protein LBB36_01260, partial [Fibromonadaceae bacterium]|nr:hypothetical protein [Fibromonadaceae bacterium]
MNPLPLFLILFFCLVSAFAENYPTYNVNRPYTLRSLDYTPLLYHYHNITLGDAPQTFFYPQVNPYFRENFQGLLRGINPDWGLEISPVLAFDIRGGKNLGDTIQGYEGGLFVRGYKDSIDFWLDARIFSEGHSSKKPQSWDREFLENQGQEWKDLKGEVEYSSYARYRGHFMVRMGWATLDFARDVPHWGPGYYNNLTLNQGAVPYNQIALSTKIGPLSVISLYGDLDAGSQSMSKDVSR